MGKFLNLIYILGAYQIGKHVFAYHNFYYSKREELKNHVAKVQETVEQVKLRKAQELLNKKAEIEDKIQKATVKREQVLVKVKETATMLYQKRSPSTDQKPAENTKSEEVEAQK